MPVSESPISSQELLDQITSISVWKRGDQRAPHKPLLLLLALAAIQRGEPRLIAYRDIDQPMAHLLETFGRRSSQQGAMYPFWHLQSDGIWEVGDKAALEAARGERKNTKHIPAAILRDTDAHAGFTRQIYEALRKDGKLLVLVADAILQAHFPDSIQRDIRDAVGLSFEMSTLRARRDPQFRETILRIYERRCAVCGYDGRLRTSELGIEAAHVRWHTHGGPDTPDNGIALCSFHHKLFDLGAIGLTEDLTIRVSQDVNGSTGVNEWILAYVGRPLRRPQSGQPPPGRVHVLWHGNEVFKAPARL